MTLISDRRKYYEARDFERLIKLIIVIAVGVLSAEYAEAGQQRQQVRPSPKNYPLSRCFSETDPVIRNSPKWHYAGRAPA